jgi:hypothetical protein
MDMLLRELYELSIGAAFRKAQNDLSEISYSTIKSAYEKNDNEVQTVAKLCEALAGFKWKSLSIHAEKIHGSKSVVEFDERGIRERTELADMVVLSIVSEGSHIRLMRLALIQNKKETAIGEKCWDINPHQLFLLENFPTITGVKGVLNSQPGKQVVFLNTSGSLGNYGLFHNSGEMYFANASTVSRAIAKKAVTLNDLEHVPLLQNTNQFPSLLQMDPILLEELLHFHFKRFPNFAMCQLPLSTRNPQTQNIYCFIRNLTLMQLGEIVEIGNRVMDAHLYSFSRSILRKIEPFADLSFQSENNFEDQEFDDALTDGLFVAVAHINIP